MNTILEKKSNKRKLTKQDIGKPTEFRHITKVRFDCNTGLDVNTSDEMYKEIFKKVTNYSQSLPLLLIRLCFRLVLTIRC